VKKLARQGQQDVYQYDTLPRPFRIQVIYIWTTAIGSYRPVSEPVLGMPPVQPKSNEYWNEIHDILARELGVFHLGMEKSDPFSRCKEFLLRAETDGALDIIELTFRWIDRQVRRLRPHEMQFANITQEPDDAIAELNYRFQEHGVGYQFADGEIVRVDSQYVHAEVVKPALALLQSTGFRGPSDEFFHAHEAYRKGRHKEAITEALKAFESTMIAICQQRRWPYPPTATAGRLVEILFGNELIPVELKNHFTTLASLLQAGLPTLRNRNAGHGQGADLVTVPGYLAAYSLHLAAANIVLMVEAHLAKR
jgi:hypothetical protein